MSVKRRESTDSANLWEGQGVKDPSGYDLACPEGRKHVSTFSSSFVPIFYESRPRQEADRQTFLVSFIGFSAILFLSLGAGIGIGC